jgi:hypothetical protein
LSTERIALAREELIIPRISSIKDCFNCIIK